MKKEVDGRTYDITTSERLAEVRHGSQGNLDDYREALYRTSWGGFFLYGSGGSNSPWAQPVMGEFGPGWDIVPVPDDFAREWASRELSDERYRSIFGEDPVELAPAWLSNPSLAQQAREASEASRASREPKGAVERIRAAIGSALRRDEAR